MQGRAVLTPERDMDGPMTQVDVRLILGDCLEVLKDLPSGSVDAAIADPPYNNGTPYTTYDDKRDDYEDWCRRWFAECRRVAGRVIVTPGHGNLWMWGQIEKPWGVGSWFKPGNPATSVLGWVCWEPWLYYTTDYRALGGPDTIRATVTKQKGVGEHPCPKPLALLTGLIEKTTKAGATVLDPFMGSGTTGVACVQTGRNFIGIEIDPTYFAIAERRIEEARQQLRMPL